MTRRASSPSTTASGRAATSYPAVTRSHRADREARPREFAGVVRREERREERLAAGAGGAAGLGAPEDEGAVERRGGRAGLLGTAATGGVAPEETGMASGLLTSSRQVGGAVGLGVLVTVAAAHDGAGGRQGPADGYAVAYRSRRRFSRRARRRPGPCTAGPDLALERAGTPPRPAETTAGTQRREKVQKNSGERVDPAGPRST
ncbi:hypothetical protein [Streptomyces canus]|uniref:hypothetical protein n=1 Tax=Streptomyces canus TaxID=58343 RepID=UPI003CF4B393